MSARVLFCDDRRSEREAFARLVEQRFAGRVEPPFASSYDGGARLDDERVDVDFAHTCGGPADGLRIIRWPTSAGPAAR